MKCMQLKMCITCWPLLLATLHIWLCGACCAALSVTKPLSSLAGINSSPACFLGPQHILATLQERKLQLYSFDGVKQREWVMDSVIR